MSDATTGAPLRVLIVEDEGFLAMEAEDILHNFGFEVGASVASVSEALSWIEESGNFDVALLDVNLRGETVFPVADALATRGIGFAFATGYGDEGVRPDLRAYPIISKPYAPEELRNALHAAATLLR
ncbi:response regulator [Rhizobium sp. TH2]|uniref:response regulator n=1 Tax=Rhizobium sp. TH2 TaxID=2775403 RepID=UPI00215752E0|nr:response regulator [Rhizobium sp. TH2]UVC07605.1 response regulator [Rhizobium sp. TH2]